MAGEEHPVLPPDRKKYEAVIAAARRVCQVHAHCGCNAINRLRYVLRQLNEDEERADES